MSTFIPMSDEITPAWLSAVLRQAGVLAAGHVTSIAQLATAHSVGSNTRRLRVRYSRDAPAAAPSRLILKRNKETLWGRSAGEEEVRFYTLVTSLPDHPPITVPCYVAAYDAASGDSYLLLLDLTDTHRQARTRDQIIGIVDAVPPPASVTGVLQALARFHAYWWDLRRLGTTPYKIAYWYCDASHFAEYLQRRTASWQALAAAESDWFPADLRALYDHVLTHLPHYWEHTLQARMQARTNLTLVHGDAYFNNFLSPIDAMRSAPTYLIDWQSPEIMSVGYDLANLLATFWTPEQRHDQEREVNALRTYHAALQASGVASYTWDDLVADYQHGLMYWLLVPLQDRFDGSARDYWWPKMECLAAAFRDWRCADLLQ